MAEMTVDRLRGAVLRNSGHIWSDTVPMIIGVRGHLDGTEVSNDFNKYNDTIYVVTRGVLHEFVGSTDPGKLTRLMNPKGYAQLVAGQYKYAPGKHKGREALKQKQKVSVNRLDPLTHEVVDQETGWFGIDIHDGGKGVYVGNWSAGCQVVRKDEWAKFLASIEYGGFEEYLYTLLEEV